MTPNRLPESYDSWRVNGERLRCVCGESFYQVDGPCHVRCITPGCEGIVPAYRQGEECGDCIEKTEKLEREAELEHTYHGE